jgi:hypothetical protein
MLSRQGEQLVAHLLRRQPAGIHPDHAARVGQDVR